MASRSTARGVNDRFVEFLENGRLNRGMPLRDQVYTLVRKAIVTGLVAPGTAINEVDIAARLGISRTPVREAVKRVSDEGLVEVFAQNGTFVADISRSQVEQAYIIRIALELESIRRAAHVITTEQVQNLEDIIHAQEVAVTRERFDEAIARDDDFHRGIAEVNGLDMVWKVVDVSKAQMDRCRLLSLPSPGAGLETIRQHRAILEALVRHDEAASMAALRDHLETSMSNTFVYLDSKLAERPDTAE
ncbi:GntR family transcriptional regulator [Roseisalinus antarcticus]|uniref:Putative HTH-type transcriptional regulator YdfH n=1 Tax=Roseisalinus antarcticus TaxID=254357 RepID=A0A1Y5RLZ2_9RHOB|nr:GntR family transcriptional regulator [Roseisalinus antarcticus]SLN17973.1 putative HTH-type transcriptional regulator YdfH [Roseisalinus antarcticus]